MAKQTYRKSRENQEKRRYQLENLVKLTAGYQQFIQENHQAIKGEIEDAIGFQNQLDQEQKGKGEFNPESLWLLRFYCSTEGQIIKNELERRVQYSNQLAVNVISSEGYYISMDGKIHPGGNTHA